MSSLHCKQQTNDLAHLHGTHLLRTPVHPNALTLTQSYESQRDLLTQMDYRRADALIVRRGYTYDILGRPTARNLARYGTETQDTFGYNTRSELTTAHVNSADYTYAYDAIGNRTAAVENGTRTAYTANKLNQYTAEGSFRPTFDADGNQTLIKTSTGIWSVTYNAKNRPVRFEKTDSSIVVECTYDTMGRRATKKVTTNGALTEHRRFLYRGYLRIDSPPPHRRLTPSGQSRFAHCPTGLTAVGRLACCDLTRAYTPALWYILWDPTQSTATRPLAIQKNGTWYTYGWDLTKNICETYRTDGRIDLAYTYTPYGEVSPAHTYDQPLRWSSEYHDTELGLVYYNYRHYNPAMGRWMRKDMVPQRKLYTYAGNNPALFLDRIGLAIVWRKTIKAYNENTFFDDEELGIIKLRLVINDDEPLQSNWITVLRSSGSLRFHPDIRKVEKVSDMDYKIIFKGKVYADSENYFIYANMLQSGLAGTGIGVGLSGVLVAAGTATGMAAMAPIAILPVIGLMLGAGVPEKVSASLPISVIVPIHGCGTSWRIGKVMENIPLKSNHTAQFGKLYFSVK